MDIADQSQQGSQVCSKDLSLTYPVVEAEKGKKGANGRPALYNARPCRGWLIIQKRKQGMGEKGRTWMNITVTFAHVPR